MKFYVYENSRIPQALSLFINIWAITLYPFIICKGELDQQRELLLIGFYLLYVWYWLVGVWKLRSFHGAYRNIPFEKEAYANDQDPTYPLNRKPYSWRKYL